MALGQVLHSSVLGLRGLTSVPSQYLITLVKFVKKKKKKRKEADIVEGKEGGLKIYV